MLFLNSPGFNFFAADIGHAPSFTWYSMLGTRDLLVAGLRWKIGDDQTARILEHPWLSRPHTFQLISKLRTLQRDSKVAIFITRERRWNSDLGKVEFLPEDA
ncbi:UNVERIFIED_CONTAM: hypothetical protein Sradi_0450300 [Sesamum radiatum]|uniref:Uncharacterized protein n=1 Tax=Sesamum radiatum TaxID=300843 RepID=A0AAW2W6J4_SESRA